MHDASRSSPTLRPSPARQQNAAPQLGPGAPVAAVDVGGTHTKLALVDADGRVDDVVRIATPRAAPDRIARDVLEAVADHLRSMQGFDDVVALGLAVPGVVDDERGVAVFSQNLGWRDTPFADLAADVVGIPTKLTHDVRAAGIAEQLLGAGFGATNLAVVTVGTGIASAVFVDGSVHVAGGFAGEIGQVVVPDGGPSAGRSAGRLEAIASASAIARRYEAAAGVQVEGAHDVVRLAATGEPAAQEVWDEAIEALAFGLSHLCAALAPERIVIGGGLSAAGDALFVPLQERLDALYGLRPVPVVTAQLGGDAGVVGAALAARKHATGAAGRNTAGTNPSRANGGQAS